MMLATSRSLKWAANTFLNSSVKLLVVVNMKNFGFLPIDFLNSIHIFARQ